MSGCAFTTSHYDMHCSICNSRLAEPSITLSMPYLDKSEVYEIWKCPNCGHGEASGRKDAGFLKQIYDSAFFASSQQDLASPTAPININAQKRVAWLMNIAQGKLLDVGCGKGAFLQAASRHFDVEGVEFSEVAAKAVRGEGISVQCGDFAEVDLPHETFDVVTLWDVLASLRDPSQALKRAHEVLKQDGLLVLTVPMIDSLIARIAGRFWPMLIPPVNLHYFSRRSISDLAAREGFEITSLTRTGKLVSLNFIAQKFCRSLRLAESFEKRASNLPAWPIRINTGDIVTVVLRRIGGPSY